MNDNPEHGIFRSADQARLLRYTCPGCGETIYTTPRLNTLVLCTLCELVLTEEEIL